MRKTIITIILVNIEIDYSNDYFWIWKRVVFIQHVSQIFLFVTENFEISPLSNTKKSTQNGQKEDVPI
jgi:hypothetical protein